MADQSPAFMPPAAAVKDNDPQVIKVNMKETEYGFRTSQQPTIDGSAVGPIGHVANGR